MLAGIDAEFAHRLLVGGERDEMLGHGAFSSFAAARNQSRAEWALVSVSCVVKVFDATMKSVVSGERLLQRLRDVRAVDIGDEMGARTLPPIRLERLRHHDRAEVRAADADVDEIGDRLARVALPFAGADRLGEFPSCASSTALTSGITSLPSTRIGVFDAVAQRDMQHRAVLRHVNLLAGKHLFRPCPGTSRSTASARNSFIVSPIIRFLEKSK